MFLFWVTGRERRRATMLQDVARHLCFINKWITNSTNSNNCGSPRLQRFHRSWWWRDVEHTQALTCKWERRCVCVRTLACCQPAGELEGEAVTLASGGLNAEYFSFVSVLKRRARSSRETPANVLWLRMAAPVPSHQGRHARHWSEGESMSHQVG